MNIAGVYCPIVTPFIEGKVAVEKLAANFMKWNQSGLSGYVALGSSGETPLLTEREKLLLIEGVLANTPEGKQIIVGTGLESTQATVAFTRKVGELGVDAALVLTPSYYKPQLNVEALRAHYLHIAEQSPIPILLYNVPVFTGLDLPVEAIVELSHHENIVGIKDSTPNLAKLSAILRKKAADFRVLVGNAHLLLAGLLTGADGATLAVANIAARECVGVFEASRTESLNQARSLFNIVATLAEKIIGPFGVPGIKAAMDLLGFYGGPPRKPLLAPTHEQIDDIRSSLKNVNLN